MHQTTRRHDNDASLGRWIGASMLFSFVVGIVSNFKLQADLFVGDGLLANAALHPDRIGIIALLGVTTAVVSLAASVALAVRLAASMPRLALLSVVAVGAGLALSLVENATLLAFRHVSEAFVASGTLPTGPFAPVDSALTGLRDGIHFLDKLLGGVCVTLFFALLLRARLVPRVLAWAGIAGAAVQMVAVGTPLFGHDVPYVLLLPLMLAYMATMLWLLARGFAGERAAA